MTDGFKGITVNYAQNYQQITIPYGYWLVKAGEKIQYGDKHFEHGVFIDFPKEMFPCELKVPVNSIVIRKIDIGDVNTFYSQHVVLRVDAYGNMSVIEV